jgi:hypothetical protein
LSKKRTEIKKKGVNDPKNTYRYCGFMEIPLMDIDDIDAEKAANSCDLQRKFSVLFIFEGLMSD